MKAICSFYLAILLLLASSLTLSAADEDHLLYEEFIAQVEAGAVKSVTLDRYSQITGTYTVDGAERAFGSFGQTGSANDVLLVRLLKQHNVATTLEEQKARNPYFDGLFGIIWLLIPLVTLVLALRINSKVNRLAKQEKMPDS